MPRKLNVLVVDDELDILQMTKEILEKAGFRVATAANTIGAGYLLKDFDPDLVVLDIMLPGSLSGDQACDTLRAFKPGLKIVFYSGIEDTQLQELGKRHRANACISKGSLPSKLVESVKQLLGKSPS